MKSFNYYLEAAPVKNETFTVKDLIALLNTMDKNLVVGTKGHFGEFHPMNKYNFSVSSAFEELSWEQRRNNTQAKEFEILNINTPDIGEEPD